MLEELTHVLADPAHWVAEVVMDGTIMLCVAYPIKKLVARHDRKVHGRGVQTSRHGVE
jgi:hypothetical protein